MALWVQLDASRDVLTEVVDWGHVMTMTKTRTNMGRSRVNSETEKRAGGLLFERGLAMTDEVEKIVGWQIVSRDV